MSAVPLMLSIPIRFPTIATLPPTSMASFAPPLLRIPITLLMLLNLKPAPIVVLPSPTRTVAPFIASDTCSLSSDYSSYTDGPTALSTEPTGNSGDVDDQDTAAHYRVSQALSKDAFKAKRPQPIHVEVYIGLAVCCISTLLGAFIVVSRIESAHARKTSTIPRRRSTSPYKTETEPDGGHNHSSFVFAQPESQFPFSDMVYEQAIASTLAERAFTTTRDFNGTTHGTINLKMENHIGGNIGSGQQEENTPRFDSSDGFQQDQKTSVRDSELPYANAGATITVFKKDAVAIYNKPRLNGSETRSNVDTTSNDEGLTCTTSNDITDVTVSAFELTLVAQPSQKDELGSKSEIVSFPGLIESSGNSNGSASVSTTLKDRMNDLLDKANGDKDFLYAKQADGLRAAVLNFSAHAVVPSRGSEEDERIVVPLGLSASIWARGMEDLSEQSSGSVSSKSDLTGVASQPGKNASFGMSTSSTLASSPSFGPTSARAPRKHTGFLRAFHAAIKESVEGRQKEGFSLKPGLLRSIVTRDATDGQFPPNQVPPEAIPSPSRRTPRGVGESSHSLLPFTSPSKATQSRSESICASGEDDHRDPLPTTPGATPLKRVSSCSSSGGGNINNESARKSSAQGKCDTSRGPPGVVHENSQSRQPSLPRYKPGRGPYGMPWVRRPE
ncbi:hypothetical protein A7U60_g1002 [Sanghuangporus baumii]|uniref:Uncharacterized protein n=1 Tax=Sanghuangporus baumii TaxID=108892 RepID=A0A9Q5I5J4_SANBA|nr:hypothetical protein A7U60_g1002 [Sanghuangporus baumii]